jgi:hypothetical protein
MDTLARLVRHSPSRVPLSGKLYASRCLKAEVDAVRDNWFRGRRPTKKLSRKVMSKFESKLPYWKDYIQGLRRQRQARTKKRAATGYDASTFTWGHEQFKDRMATHFAEAVKKAVPKGKWLVLDDFPKNARSGLRTLGAIKDAGLPVSHAHVSNPGARQAASAKRAGAVAARLLCENALAAEWSAVPFSAAYLDVCAGSGTYVTSLVDQVLKNSTRRFVLGVTLTSRDSTGQSMLERVVAMDAHLTGMGLRAPATALREHLFYFKPKSVVTLFYCR